jgi:hypothetical protein
VIRAIAALAVIVALAGCGATPSPAPANTGENGAATSGPAPQPGTGEIGLPATFPSDEVPLIEGDLLFAQDLGTGWSVYVARDDFLGGYEEAAGLLTDAGFAGGTEFTEPDFGKPDDDGSPRIAEDAHVRLAHPSVNGGVRLLRRGYNFVDGNDSLGRLDAGLFFLSFQRDPGQFVAVQRSLAGHDALKEFIKHVGSASFAIPPGIREGTSVGDALFG